MKMLNIFAWLYPSYAQMNVAAAVVGSAVVGGVMNSNAAGKAAGAQSAAAADANALQQYQFDQTRRDNAPFLRTGTAANNKLAILLGLQGGGSAGSYNGQELLNYNAQGIPSYNPTLYRTNAAYKKAYDDYSAMHQAQYGQGYTAGSDATQIENYLRNALPEETLNNASDPQFGSLLKPYGQSDAENDYIYQTQKQFGLDQGVNALNRQAAASGGLMSGATAKALTRFGNDYAGTKLGESYNRYNNDQSNVFNRLSGISGTGQQAVNQVSTAGQNYANQVGNNLTSLGNARGASAISGANSFNNALSQGANYYQNQQLINSLGRNNASGAYFNSGGMGGFGDSYSTSYGE